MEPAFCEVVFAPADPSTRAELEQQVAIGFVIRRSGHEQAGVFRPGLTWLQLARLLQLLAVAHIAPYYEPLAESEDGSALLATIGARVAEIREVLSRLSAAEQRQEDEKHGPIRPIGMLLFAALIEDNQEVARMWEQWQQAAGSAHEREHRLVFHFIAGTQSGAAAKLLLGLPWEALWDPRAADPVSVAADRTLSVVRCYRPRDDSPYEQGQIEPEPMPELLLIEDPELEAMARIAAPAERYGRDLLWCQLRHASLAELQEGTRPFGQPQAIHYFGRGARIDGETWLIYDQAPDSRHSLGPYSLALRMLAGERRPQLLVSFACHSGAQVGDAELAPPVVLQAAEEGLPLLRRTMIDDLALRLPAIVAMQGLVGTDAAAQLSRAFYQALAEGKALSLALHAARRTLYMATQRVGAVWTQRWSGQAWWLPTLYLRAPLAGCSFYSQERRKEGWYLGDCGEHYRALEAHDNLLEELTVGGRLPRAFVVSGEAGSGRSHRLLWLARELRERQFDVLPFLSPRRMSEANLIERVQREVAALLRLRISPTGDLQRGQTAGESYRALLRDPAWERPEADRAPLYVLIDDGDRIDPAELAGLFPAGARAPLAIVLLANKDWREPSVEDLWPGTTNLEHRRITPAQLQKLLKPNFELYKAALPQLQRDAGLSEDAVTDLQLLLAHADRPLTYGAVSDLFQGFSTATRKMIELMKQYDLLVAVSEGGFQLSDPALRQLLDPDLHPSSPQPNPRFIELVEVWRNRKQQDPARWSGIDQYPRVLIELLTHRGHRRLLDPFRSDLPRGNRYRHWYALAHRSKELGCLDGWIELALDHAERKQTLACERLFLQSLVMLLEGRPPLGLGGAYLWSLTNAGGDSALSSLPLPRDRIALWEALRNGDPDAFVSELARLQEPERALVLACLCGTFGRAAPAGLAQFAAALRPILQPSDQTALGRGLGLALGHSRGDELPQLALLALDDAIHHDAAAARALFVALLPLAGLAQSEYRARAEQIAAAWRLEEHDEALPPLVDLVASMVLDRCLGQTGPAQPASRLDFSVTLLHSLVFDEPTGMSQIRSHWRAIGQMTEAPQRRSWPVTIYAAAMWLGELFAMGDTVQQRLLELAHAAPFDLAATLAALSALQPLEIELLAPLLAPAALQDLRERSLSADPDLHRVPELTLRLLAAVAPAASISGWAEAHSRALELWCDEEHRRLSEADDVRALLAKSIERTPALEGWSREAIRDFREVVAKFGEQGGL